MNKNQQRQLAEKARRGDFDAFRRLVEEHQRRIFVVAVDYTSNRADAEDIVQEVLVKAFRSIKKFKGQSSFGTWLYRITVNTCLDFRRKQRVRQTQSLEESQVVQWVSDEGPGPEQQARASRVVEEIRRATLTLTPRERTVFIMRHFEQMTTREVATILDRSEGTVKNLLFRAIRKLRDELVHYKGHFGLEDAR